MEINDVVQYIPYFNSQQIVIFLLVMVCLIVAVSKLLDTAFNLRGKALDRVVDKVIAHEAFGQIQTSITELRQCINDLVVCVAKQDAMNKKLFLSIMGNNLRRMYYELKAMPAMNDAVYREFMAEFDTYESLGGNGAIASLKSDLQEKRRAEISMTAVNKN